MKPVVGQLYRRNTDDLYLTKGKSYKILQTGSGGTVLIVDDEGDEGWYIWYPEKWALVPNNNPFHKRRNLP
jgi:hypothetical protein